MVRITLSMTNHLNTNILSEHHYHTLRDDLQKIARQKEKDRVLFRFSSLIVASVWKVLPGEVTIAYSVDGSKRRYDKHVLTCEPTASQPIFR